MSAPDRLLEAWAVLAAAASDDRAVRVESTGVTTDAGDVLAGLDVHGSRHLLIPIALDAPVNEDRRSAGVQIRRALLEDTHDTIAFVDVVCLVPALNDLFADVAADMLDALQTSDVGPAAVCTIVLDRWRELLERRDPRLLGPQQLAGLFGELLILRELASMESTSALRSWTGPAHDQHDFTATGLALEVKTTTVREGRRVEVHGIEQLTPPQGGDLFLAFVRLDVDGGGMSVPLLVDELAASGLPRRELLERLLRAGYDDARRDDYEHPRFLVKEQRVYLAGDNFPRVTATSFVGGQVPPGVLRIRYEIDLTNEPPTPLDPDAVRQVLTRFRAP